MSYDGSSSVSDYVDITGNKHGGNPQSIAANAAVSKRKGQYRKLIYDWFLRHGDACAEDALAAFPKLRYSTVTARISELRRDGLLEQVGITHTKYSGKEAALLRAVYV